MLILNLNLILLLRIWIFNDIKIRIKEINVKSYLKLHVQGTLKYLIKSIAFDDRNGIVKNVE